MTSRLDLRNLCRRRLGDLTAPTHWSDLQINQWINDAVADYSLYFPRSWCTPTWRRRRGACLPST